MMGSKREPQDLATGARLDRISAALLAPVVRRALGNAEAEVVDWDHDLVKGEWLPGGRLVARLSGRAQVHGDEVRWAVFLKVPNPTHTHYDPWHREEIQREPLLYASGLLDDLPGGMGAPRCFGVTERGGDEPWIWLEDVGGTPSLQWPVERFGLAARHFGRMQGTFMAGKPLPDEPWLETSHWVRARLVAGAERVPPILERFRTDPLTERIVDSEIGEGVRRLWAEREAVFDALEHTPKGLCHGDFNYTNLFARQREGDDETVAVDWQYAGIRQIGEDIAGLIADSSIIPVRRKAAEPEDFTELVLDGYLAGLRESDWNGDLGAARYAVVARLAWPWTFNLLLGLDGAVLQQSGDGRSREQLKQRLDEYVERQRFLLRLAEHARALLNPAPQ